jgi:hypothetical protein
MRNLDGWMKGRPPPDRPRILYIRMGKVSPFSENLKILTQKMGFWSFLSP